MMNEGDTLGARFVLERLAGEGGMATVWRAHDRETNGPVAIKILLETSDATALARFTREARLLAGMNHPSIVRYVAHGMQPPHLAMEWLDGIDLAQWLLARSRPTVSETLRLGRSLARALVDVHALGLVHRDIKPSNIFLVGGDIRTPKLVDFGLARGLGSQDDLTRSNLWIGTPAYMSPEQARTDRATLATDVFALGAVLYECLTGRPAFAGPHVIAILTKIAVEDVGPPSAIDPDIPDDLDELVSRMMSKAPRDRPDAETVLEALDSIEIDRPSRMLAAPSLGREELRFVSVVLVDAKIAHAPTIAADAVVGVAALPDASAIDRLASVHHAPLVRLVGGALAAVIMGENAATDFATRAVRLALALRENMPGAPIVVATAQALVSTGARVPLGDAIDRAAALFESAPVSANHEGVTVDETTRKLLDARFEISGRAVIGERAWAARTLLGKPTPCVGRERDIAFLAATFEQCVEQNVARAVLLTGPAGVGKTRVVHEWLRDATAAAEEVWTLQGDPVQQQEGSGLLGRMLRNVAGIRVGDDDAHERLRTLIERTIPIPEEGGAARVLAFLSEALQLPHQKQEREHPLLHAARLDPKIMSQQVQRAWTDLFDARTSLGRPLILVVEDVHWCDEATLGFVGHALRLLDDRPFFVVGLSRSDVSDLWPMADRTNLGPITKQASATLARAVLTEAEADEATIGKLVEQAAGNALLLEELVRAAGSGESGGETVLAIVSARLEGIHEHGRRLLRAASIYGHAFWRGAVAALLPGDLDVEAWLDRLVRMEMIQRGVTSRFANEAEYVFRHALVRDAAHATLIDSDRRLGHVAAAGWLERSGEPDAAMLAEHYEAGGRPDRAAPFWARAARTALQGNDVAHALARAERGLACGELPGELLGELRAVRACAVSFSTRSDAEALALEALSVLERGSAAWFQVIVEVMRARFRAQDVTGIREVAGEMLETAPKPDAELHAALAAAAGARLLLTSDERDACAGLLAFAEHVNRERPDPLLEMRLHRARSVDSISRGRLGLALAEIDKARTGAEKLDNTYEVLASSGELVDVLLQVGQWERAAARARLSLAASKKLGFGLAPYIELNLAIALARLGNVAEAIAALDTVIATSNDALALSARIYRADMKARSGDRGAAREDAAVALGATDDVSRALALGVMARIELASKNFVAALEASSAAMAIVEKLGSLYDGEMGIRLVHGEALEACGREDDAHEVFRVARALVLERAASIDDPELEKSFRENVEEHARILATAC